MAIMLIIVAALVVDELGLVDGICERGEFQPSSPHPFVFARCVSRCYTVRG